MGRGGSEDCTDFLRSRRIGRRRCWIVLRSAHGRLGRGGMRQRSAHSCNWKDGGGGKGKPFDGREDRVGAV